jgi:hypothetical protein
VTMQTLRRSRSLNDDLLVARPVVVPTRRQIGRRFPSLGFTISTSAPFVELIVTTDPALIDPQRSSARTPATFYASRSNGGLTPTVAGRARYVVPADVVERLVVGAEALWYLAVAYDDATGAGGVASSPSGATGVVTVDRSFRRSSGTRRAHSLGRIGGIGLGANAALDDKRDGEDGRDLVEAPLSMTAARHRKGRSLVSDADPLSDRLDGEDGADLPSPTPVAAPTTPPLTPAVPAPQPVSPAPTSNGGSGPASTAAPAGPVEPDRALIAGAQSWADALAADGYEDGWDDWDAPRAGQAALADEYPDIDWGAVDVGSGNGRSHLGRAASADHYGRRPDYYSLDDAATSPNGAAGAVASPVKVALPSLDLPAEMQRSIIELTAAGHDGAGYSSINADGPFRGRFGPGHKAYQRYHTGLSFGVAEFNQDSGSLGRLLKSMHGRDPDQFAALFGPEAMLMLEMVTAPGPSGELVEGGRGPRVQPVNGVDLWEEPWVSRFRAAGEVPAFRAAQNQLAAELFLAPMLPVAAGFGLTTQRALCMVFDRAVVLGEHGARRWIADTVGPARTPALRSEALAALGYDSIETFQSSVPGLLTDGEFGPVTHATLAAGLRGLGASSPVPVLTTRQMLDEMVARAEGEPGASRLVRLATAPELGDTALGG